MKILSNRKAYQSNQQCPESLSIKYNGVDSFLILLIYFQLTKSIEYTITVSM